MLPSAVVRCVLMLNARRGGCSGRAPVADSARDGTAYEVNLFSLVPKDVWVAYILPLVEFADAAEQFALGEFELASMRAEAQQVLRQPLRPLAV